MHICWWKDVRANWLIVSALIAVALQEGAMEWLISVVITNPYAVLSEA